MKPVILQLANIKGVPDLAKKAHVNQEPIVVSLPGGEELVAMSPRVLDQILHHRTCLDTYSEKQ